MLHACVKRFDVMCVRGNILGWEGEVNAALAASPGGNKMVAATTDGHIKVYDATRSQYTYDHDLRCWKPWTILLALSSSRRHDDDMSMLVATELLDFSEPGTDYQKDMKRRSYMFTDLYYSNAYNRSVSTLV
jgi:hypothetical protein